MGSAGGTRRSSTSTISLDEGTYVYFCTFGRCRPHYTARHARRGHGEGHSEHRRLCRRRLPRWTPSEYKFDVNGLKAGDNTLTFANKGNQFHHLVAVPLNEGATLDDVKTFLGCRTNR